MRNLLAVFVLVALAAAALPAAVASPNDKAITVTGTIARVQASERTIAVALADGSEARFVWNPETKINGILTQGAKVTIRYAEGADGKKVALQITVARG